VYLERGAMQSLNPPNRTQRESEAIPTRSTTMRLAGKRRAGTRTCTTQKTARRRAETKICLGQVQFANIMISNISFLIALRRLSSRGAGRRDGQLGGDLVQRVLRGRQAELALEERGFGGILVAVGQVETLHWVEELLRLGDEGGDVPHCRGGREARSRPDRHKRQEELGAWMMVGSCV
jgi:hypothetical protein